MLIPAGKISVGPPIGRFLAVDSLLPFRGSLPPTLQRLLTSVERFLQVESVGAGLLLIATIAASKSAILLASVLAAVIGLVSGRCILPSPARAMRTKGASEQNSGNHGDRE